MGGLRTVFRDGIAGEITATGRELRHPADHGNGQNGLRATGLAAGHKIVRRTRRRVGAVGNALEEPVGAAIMRVELPVVAGFGIAARTVEGRVQLCQGAGTGERNAVDQRVDGPLIEGGVDRNCDRRIGCRRGRGAANERDVVQIKRRYAGPAAVLNPEAIKVRCGGDTERSHRDGDLLPGIGGQGRNGHR